jgi:hypothetical protein
MVELGEFLPFVGALPPGLEDLAERGEGAGQRRLGTEVKRDIGHGTSPRSKSEDVDGVHLRFGMPLYK